MKHVREGARLARAGLLISLSLAHAWPAAAQESPMTPLGVPASREGSGTSWLPDASPMYAVHQNEGSWELMAHGNVFLQYLVDQDPRGVDQFGSINWLMGMARRPLAGGRFGVKTMLSLEPATIGGCGYPDLLATGEFCDGEAIVDRQHPHDLFMELAVHYERAMNNSVAWQIYGGPAGEPALGPVAFPHRLSAMPNPLAPISHHWLDATHITYGVVTGAVYGRRWKTEVSVFNGREPDEERWDLDLAALDSVSGRVTFLPTASLALQVSAGTLNDAEPGHDGEEAVDVDRITASLTYHRATGTSRLWASTFAWGRNAEDGESSNFFLAETSLLLNDVDAWFGRVDAGQKSAHDLDVHGLEGQFTVAKLQGGYTRFFSVGAVLKAGLGGTVTMSLVPDELEAAYGGSARWGGGVFLTLRPSAMWMSADPHAGHH